MHNYNFVFKKDDVGNFLKNQPFVFSLENEWVNHIKKASEIFFYRINYGAYRQHKNYNTIKNISHHHINFNITDLEDLSEKDYCYYYISFNVMYAMFLPQDFNNKGNVEKTGSAEILSTLENSCKFILPDEIKKLLDKDKCKIILDTSKEGVGHLIQWDKFFKLTNLTPDQVIHTTGDVLLGSNISIPTTFYNHWERNVATLSFSRHHEVIHKLEELILTKEKRKWYGLCLNRVTKPHRIEICKFVAENLPNKIDYSFGLFSWNTLLERDKQTDKPLDTALFQEWKYRIANDTASYFANPADAKEYFTWLSKHNEKSSDLEPNTSFSHNMVTFFNNNSYYNSYFSIVCETFYEQQGALFVSEKIFKPIAYLQPFIVVGQAYVIEYMRHLGYDVFDDIIDHSYDKILNPRHRMEKIKKELIRLCRISSDQWADILYHIFPRLYSNYHHLNLAFYRDDKLHMPIHLNEPKYYEPIHSFETKEEYRKLSSLLNSKVELSNSFYSSLYSNMEYANLRGRTYTNEIYNHLLLNKNMTNSYYNKNYNYDSTT